MIQIKITHSVHIVHYTTPPPSKMLTHAHPPFPSKILDPPIYLHETKRRLKTIQFVPYYMAVFSKVHLQVSARKKWEVMWLSLELHSHMRYADIM